jgi:hypothetical protein
MSPIGRHKAPFRANGAIRSLSALSQLRQAVHLKLMGEITADAAELMAGISGRLTMTPP